MKMAEAKQELMEIADGRYHSIEYKIDDHGNGNASQECTVYLSDYGHFKAAQWESALAQLRSAMNGQPAISEELPVTQRIKAA